MADIDGNRTTTRRTGWIARIVADKGFGFIRTDTDGKDYFFHASELQNCEIGELQGGWIVTFEASQGEKGWRANRVCIRDRAHEEA